MDKQLSYLAVALSFTLAIAAWADPAKPAPQGVAQSRGALLYRQQCSMCHGPEGKGDGPAAYLLFPKPRDFTMGRFKVRSTSTGQMPADNDLFRTITNGMPGSAMPSFAFLSEADRRILVAFIKTLSVVESEGQQYNLFELRGTPMPIKVGVEPLTTPEMKEMGKEVYAKLECWKCHGTTGRGDGPSSDQLLDEKGYPILPNDFTRGIYKGGGTNRDVYLRFTTGMDGTPMPSYEELAT